MMKHISQAMTPGSNVTRVVTWLWQFGHWVWTGMSRKCVWRMCTVDAPAIGCVLTGYPPWKAKKKKKNRYLDDLYHVIWMTKYCYKALNPPIWLHLLKENKKQAGCKHHSRCWTLVTDNKKIWKSILTFYWSLDVYNTVSKTQGFSQLWDLWHWGWIFFGQDLRGLASQRTLHYCSSLSVFINWIRNIRKEILKKMLG